MKGIRKMKKKQITAAALICMLAAAGCGNKGSETVTGNIDFKDYPIQTDDKLTYYVQLNSNVAAVSENLGTTPFAEELMKETGVNVEFIHPPIGQESEELNIVLASDDLPDIIETNWYGFSGGPSKALSDGFIMKLNDLIESDSPNLKKYLSEHQDIDKNLKTDDNEYYAYPFIRGDEKLLVSRGIIIRQDWLDELGLEMPETLDEWHNVLTQFKEKKGVQSPLSYQDGMFKDGEFIGAYGITSDFTVENGKVIYGPYDERYKDFLAEFAKWYKEGLIDQNIASVDGKSLNANILNGRTGATFGFAGSGLGTWLKALNEKDAKANLTAAPHVAAKKGEKPKLGAYDMQYTGIGGAAITTSCKNPSLAARFLDFGYSEKGNKLYNFGIEGESYNMVDNYPTYTDIILKNPDGLAVGAAMGQYIRANQMGPFVQDKEYIEQYYAIPQQQEALDIWGNSDMKSYQLPQITFTSEESSEIASIKNNVKTYVDESTIKFITGIDDLSKYDEYVSNLKSFGADRMLEIYQAAYDRYMKR